MKISFATLGCPDWSLEEAIEQAAALGFDGVEIRGASGNHIGPDESLERCQAIAHTLKQHGVEAACIMGYTNFASADQREPSQQAVRNFLPICEAIGCPTLRIFGGDMGDAPRDQVIADAAAAIQPVAQEAHARGVTLALETHDAWCKADNLVALADAVDSPGLTICWDISNAWFVEPLDVTYPQIADRISHVHFKDGQRNSEGKVHSVLPGQGEVDLEQAFALLRDGGYDRYLSFEWEKKWEPDLAEPEVAFPHFANYVRKLMG